MSAISTIVASGQTNGPAFTLELPQFPHVVQVPSLSAGASVRLQFAASSGTTFCDAFREDGSGGVHYVASGDGPFFGYVPRPASPWGRVVLGAAQSEACTFTVVPARRV